MRDAAKWLLAAAAGLSSVLIGGLSVSDLPTALPQLLLAVGGLAAAIVAAAWIIESAGKLLATRHPTFRSLLTVPSPDGSFFEDATNRVLAEIESNGDILYGGLAETPRDLFVRLRDAGRKVQSTDDTTDLRDKAVLEWIRLKEASDRVAEFADYVEVTSQFRLLRYRVRCAGFVILLGTLTFASLIRRDGPEDQTVTQALPVTVFFTNEGAAKMARKAGCFRNEAKGVAVGGTLTEPIVSFPREPSGCEPVSLRISSSEGISIPDDLARP